jgi:hypothetical protein
MGPDETVAMCGYCWRDVRDEDVAARGGHCPLCGGDLRTPSGYFEGEYQWIGGPEVALRDFTRAHSRRQKQGRNRSQLLAARRKAKLVRSSMRELLWQLQGQASLGYY